MTSPADRIDPGAYGVRVAGLENTPWLGVIAAAHWPLLTLERSGEEGADPTVTLDPLGAVLAAGTGCGEVVHPLLGRLGAQIALARGGDALHAGALSGKEGAWGVVGPKEAGKSTLLAACAHDGRSVLTDDVLVVADGRAMAGPRCVDLRPSAARFGRTDPVRPDDPRCRMSLPPVQAERPLMGFIHLEWSNHGPPSLNPLTSRGAIRRFLRLREEKGYPRDPKLLLELAGLPGYVLQRPRSWDLLAETLALIRAELLTT